jgi:hypothetical protein
LAGWLRLTLSHPDWLVGALYEENQLSKRTFSV